MTPIKFALCAALSAVATLSASPVRCDEVSGMTLGMHVASWYSVPGYNNVNPGLYLRAPSGLTVGTYRNSVRRQSSYIAWTFSAALVDGLSAEVTAGAITGYPAAEVLPLVAPSLRIGTSTGPAMRLTFLPRVHEKQGAHVVHLSTEWSL